MQTYQTYADIFTLLRNWPFPKEYKNVCIGLVGLQLG